MQPPMDHPRIYEILILQSRSHHFTKQNNLNNANFRKEKKSQSK